MKIIELDPHDSAQAGPWYAAMRAGAAAGRVSPLVTGETALLSSLRFNDSNPNMDRRGFGVWDRDVCLGTALLDLPQRSNPTAAELDVNVPPQYRGRGVGGALLRHSLDVAGSQGRTLITGELNIPGKQAIEDSDGGRFLLRHGFVSAHTEERLMLELPATVPAHDVPDGYSTVAWVGVPPARWLDSFAEMQTLMGRDVPTGDLGLEPPVRTGPEVAAGQQRLADQGYGLVTALVLGPAGSPVAYSMMFVPGDDPAHVIQDDTFVLRAHRGHGLGTVAKAANLGQLTEHFPQTRYVHTWTAEVNDAMRTINERFGFRAVETMHAMKLVTG
ncbi:GNAT family N-acetyltransferase [Longispora albida]|uniref:GNAT family N-acetyltransferase n=1 Tax=Longispora albida TaxID=203523 RepID=UPI00035EB03A|nr:GNAT family N-acetyltransferase [Longispora albida]